MKSETVYLRGTGLVAFLLLGLLIVSGTELAQADPTSNVNLIGMTPDPDDIPDDGYRQQNEPACAVRPDDSACYICAYNDYRGVDFPLGSPIGDSWLGVSQSCDAGATWRSRIMPGHPGDTDADVIPAAFAADPRVVSIPGWGNPGMAILNFIAGYRDSNVGVLGIQHWLDVNKEDADHNEPGRTTWFADTGTSGRFIDKPDILAVLDPVNQQGPVELVTEMENTELGIDGVITRNFPSGKLYVAYAVLTGSNSFKVLYNTSDDWGRTFKNQTKKLSEDQNQVSGISLTSVNDRVVAVWRRLGDNNDLNSIMFSVITNGGKKNTSAEVLANVCAFDQPTLAGETFEIQEGVPEGPFVAFRTNDFPWVANDGENVFVFYSERKRNPDGSCNVLGRPRIVMKYSTDAGQTWLGQPGSDLPIVLNEPSDPPAPGSFQFMPTAFGANGRIQVAWYDTRREIFGGAGTIWPFVTDYDVADALFVQRAVDVYTTSVTLTDGVLDIPPPIRVSQFSAQLAERDGQLFFFDTEASLANKKLFGKGTASFLGDYIAMAARGFRPASGETWESNASLRPAGLGSEDFFTAWADNRDVIGEVLSLTDPSPYGFQPTESVKNTESDATSEEMLADNQLAPPTGPPRDMTKTAEGLDGNDNLVGCTPETERTRNSNIYGSRIPGSDRFFAPTPSKPLSGLKRAFPVSLTNSSDDDLTYLLRIVPAGDASFRQQSLQTTETVIVRARSTEARTVFVDPIAISSVKVEALLGTVVVATIELGNTPGFFDPENCPDGDPSCDVDTNELHDLELQQLSPEAAALLNAALLNAALLNIGVEAGDLADDAVNAALLNAALLNADLLNANLLNPTLVALAQEGGAQDPSCGTADPTYPSLCPDYVGEPITADIINFAVDDGGETINAALLNAALLNAALLNANLLNANLLNANLLNANLLNANLLNANLLNANLLNANLLNANLLNANLLNADLLNANLLNANLLNANLLNATITEDPTAIISYDDYTYPVTNNGNVTTSINADIQISAPNAVDAEGKPILDANGDPIKDVLGTKLIAWTANAVPTRVDCEDRVQLDARVQSIAPNPDNDLEIADISSPFEGEVTAIAAPGETVFYTLRVVGTLEQLRNVRVSGFTASSQASNCRADGSAEGFCEENLRNDNERILFTDEIPPELTLNGDNPLEVEAGEPYVEAGATALDNVDGDISASVVISGDIVDTGTVGTYFVEYNVSDSAGNPAVALTRTVNVVDTSVPVITLNGAATVTLEVGVDDYTEQGATATDAGDPTVTIIIGGDVVLAGTVGTYVVTYDATDASGNVALQVTRTVQVVDTSAPVITLNGAATVTLEAGIDSYTEDGATATDAGDPSVAVVIGGDVVDAGTVGTYVVTYDATDASGNVATQVTRTVNVVDSTAPLIFLNGDAIVTLEADRDDYVELGATIIDVGSPATPVIIGGDTVDTNTIGTYIVTYNATDASGNVAAQVTRTVNVVDTTAPVFDPVTPPDGFDPDSPFPFQLAADSTTLTLTWPVSVTDADPNLAISCSIGGVELDLVGELVLAGDQVTATFSYNFPVGDTVVECTATDANQAATISFTVTVLDVTAPVIIVPSEPLVIDSLISPAIVDYSDQVEVVEYGYPGTEAVCEPASGTEFTWGDTVITCNAVDGSGNQADTVNFTVTLRYLYDVNLILPKGRAQSGSTVPLDWQYLNRASGLPIDSSAFMVGVTWEKATDSSCTTLTPAPTDGASFLADADSGNSDFRYSFDSDTWQLSWQTPDALGWHKISVVPPGGDVADAWGCINLK